MILYLSAKNASKEYNRLSGIINRNLFPHNSGGYKSQIRVPGRWGSGKNSFFPGWLLPVSSHRVGGLGKEIEEKTQRHRENSLVFPFLKTLNLLDECSTLRAHLTLMSFSGGSDGKESAHSWETGVQSLGLEGSLEKGMASHSSILAWEIPWTEESGGLKNMRSQKIEPFSKHSTLAVKA